MLGARRWVGLDHFKREVTVYKAVPKACKIFQTLMLSNCIMVSVMNVNGPTVILHRCTLEKHPKVQPRLAKRLLRTGLLVGYCLCQSSTAAPIALSHPITPVKMRALSASELRVGESWKTKVQPEIRHRAPVRGCEFDVNEPLSQIMPWDLTTIP